MITAARRHLHLGLAIIATLAVFVVACTPGGAPPAATPAATLAVLRTLDP